MEGEGSERERMALFICKSDCQIGFKTHITEMYDWTLNNRAQGRRRMIRRWQESEREGEEGRRRRWGEGLRRQALLARVRKGGRTRGSDGGTCDCESVCVCARACDQEPRVPSPTLLLAVCPSPSGGGFRHSLPESSRLRNRATATAARLVYSSS